MFGLLINTCLMSGTYDKYQITEKLEDKNIFILFLNDLAQVTPPVLPSYKKIKCLQGKKLHDVTTNGGFKRFIEYVWFIFL